MIMMTHARVDPCFFNNLLVYIQKSLFCNKFIFIVPFGFCLFFLKYWYKWLTTVVIHFKNTFVAYGTVMASLGFENLTGFASIAISLGIFNVWFRTFHHLFGGSGANHNRHREIKHYVETNEDPHRNHQLEKC